MRGMTLLMGRVLALLIAGCGTPAMPPSAAGSAYAAPSRPQAAGWPGVPYKTVTAYEFVRTHGQGVLLKKDGRYDLPEMMKRIGRFKISEKDISVERAAGIFRATTCGIPKEPGSFRSIMCYMPHHVLVYKDGDGQPVAALEICATCERWEVSSHPELIEEGYMDKPKIKATFAALGMLHEERYDLPVPGDE